MNINGTINQAIYPGVASIDSKEETDYYNPERKEDGHCEDIP